MVTKENQRFLLVYKVMNDIVFIISTFPSSNFMFDLPQIAYGNMALIFPSHFRGYNKNEISADYVLRYIRCDQE
jgi:hypothetical protein